MAENSSLRYRSYDAIRGDHFEKHAPFDGVIFDARISDVILKEAFDRIREDVNESPGDCGTIAVRTREFLEDSGVFTVEIKSSLLQDPRDYRAMGQKRREGVHKKIMRLSAPISGIPTTTSFIRTTAGIIAESPIFTNTLLMSKAAILNSKPGAQGNFCDG